MMCPATIFKRAKFSPQFFQPINFLQFFDNAGKGAGFALTKITGCKMVSNTVRAGVDFKHTTSWQDSIKDELHSPHISLIEIVAQRLERLESERSYIFDSLTNHAALRPRNANEVDRQEAGFHDLHARFPAAIFVVGCLVGILEPSPARDIVDKDRAEPGRAKFDISDHLLQRVTATGDQPAFGIIRIGLDDLNATALGIFTDGLSLVLG